MHKTVSLSFSSELRFFLPDREQATPRALALPEPAAVKHAIEAVGVPHTEVGMVLVNGDAVNLAHLVQPSDAITIFGLLDAPVRADAVLLRPALSRPPRFVIDTHLGRLASYLRLFGFDALYRNTYNDAELAAISATEDRVLLTRDRGLLKRKIVVYGWCVRDTRPQYQLVEVMVRYALASEAAPWTRCARCNGLLTPVSKDEILDQLEPRTKLYYNKFKRCEQCGQIYWQGSHMQKMQSFVSRVLAEVRNQNQGAVGTNQQ